MKFQSIKILFLHVALVGLQLGGEVSHGQAKRQVNPEKTAVDVVSVQGTGRLSGFILSKTDNSITMAVRRKWFRENHPDVYKKHLKSEKGSVNGDKDQRRKRLEAWKTEKQKLDKDGLLTDFIDRELAAEPVNAVDPTTLDFTVVQIETDKVRKIYAKTEDQRRLAGIGWSLKIDDVESLAASVLARRLKAQNIDLKNHPVNLGDQLPSIVDSDRQWEIRKALVEFALLPRLEYQGSGSMFFRRGESANPMQMIGQLLNGGGGLGGDLGTIGKELGLPEFQNFPSRKEKQDSAIDRMTRTAEKEGRSAFSATTLDQGRVVKVTTELFIRSSDGKWNAYRSFSATQNPADQAQDDVDALLDQPQIKQMTDLTKQFGLAGGGTVDLAVRNGVATQKALNETMSQMDEFIEGFAQGIDGPPVSQ